LVVDIPLSEELLIPCALGFADGFVVPDGFVADGLADGLVVGFVDAEGLGCAAGGGALAELVSTAPLLVLLLGLVLQAAVSPTRAAAAA
jgi:hypothetical protein